MNVFFDTSVLVAACERSHPHHARVRPIMARVTAGTDRGFISTHSIAETFAVLTRLPVQPRIHPLEAAKIILETLLPRLQLVPVGEADYRAALGAVAAGGWTGGKIYDALLLQCAQRSGADRVYTFNLRDFGALAPAAIKDRICAP